MSSSLTLFQWHNFGMDNDEPIKTQLRLPAALQERLVLAAKASGRSMNAEMVYRLDNSFSLIEGELLDRRQEEMARLVLEILPANGRVGSC